MAAERLLISMLVNQMQAQRENEDVHNHANDCECFIRVVLHYEMADKQNGNCYQRNIADVPQYRNNSFHIRKSLVNVRPVRG